MPQAVVHSACQQLLRARRLPAPCAMTPLRPTRGSTPWARGNRSKRIGVQVPQNETTASAGEGPLAQLKISVNKDTGGSSTIERSTDVHVPVRTAYKQWT